MYEHFSQILVIEIFERHYKLQDTIPQNSGESTTGRRF